MPSSSVPLSAGQKRRAQYNRAKDRAKLQHQSEIQESHSTSQSMNSQHRPARPSPASQSWLQISPTPGSEPIKAAEFYPATEHRMLGEDGKSMASLSGWPANEGFKDRGWTSTTGMGSGASWASRNGQGSGGIMQSKPRQMTEKELYDDNRRGTMVQARSIPTYALNVFDGFFVTVKTSRNERVLSILAKSS
ncbi:hypothetical protein HBI25_092150 [Parastagonospora nodorum]|nr:hypothetical protein HBI76_121000 [Parastagonospora nodorum]KAH5036968.1 hypothetical protein HBI75_076480 [Parastagonospora nodorum]KAH5255720.1 hypothetical protein HBI72_127840 [Parastagonospora nodorum]KAH5562439.1 hypothetical protein HBI25_092150 [Parastagonospora nodorum]KAH5664599.1 hypothetical protein HBI23_075960 [Parastagonospora nodorum]